jgi:hypothetical protein
MIAPNAEFHGSSKPRATPQYLVDVNGIPFSSTNPVPISNTSSNQRVNALAGDIIDIATLLSLAGAAGDTNTANSIMGRLTKIRDVLLATITIQGSVTETNSTPISSSLASILTQVTDHSATSPSVSSSSISNVAADTSSKTILASNSSRKSMMLYNDSSSAMYLAYSATASLSSYSVKISANTLFEMPPGVTYTGAMSAVWDTASGNARVTEL